MPAKPQPRPVKRSAVSSATTAALGTSSAATSAANTTVPKSVHAAAADALVNSDFDHNGIPDLEDVSDDEEEGIGAGGDGNGVDGTMGVDDNDDIVGGTGAEEDLDDAEGEEEHEDEDEDEEVEEEVEEEAEDAGNDEMGYTYEEMKAFAEADRQVCVLIVMAFQRLIVLLCRPERGRGRWMPPQTYGLSSLRRRRVTAA